VIIYNTTRWRREICLLLRGIRRTMIVADERSRVTLRELRKACCSDRFLAVSPLLTSRRLFRVPRERERRRRTVSPSLFRLKLEKPPPFPRKQRRRRGELLRCSKVVHRPHEAAGGHEGPCWQESERLTAVAICPVDKTHERNAHCPSAGSSRPPRARSDLADCRGRESKLEMQRSRENRSRRFAVDEPASIISRRIWTLREDFVRVSAAKLAPPPSCFIAETRGIPEKDRRHVPRQDDQRRWRAVSLAQPREFLQHCPVAARPLTMAFPFAQPPTNDPPTYRSPRANCPKKAEASRRRLEDEATRGEPPARGS